MTRLRLLAPTLLLMATSATPARSQADHHARGSLASFTSDSALSRYLRQLAATRGTRGTAKKLSGSMDSMMPMEAAAPGTASAATSGAAKDESVTNTQHAGVDEGGIVKLHGNHLVVLRRGRLFTVSIADGTLRPSAAVAAFGAGIDPRGTWYDELLIDGDKVIVVGFSYARGGTEIGTFRLDQSGGLQHLATYQLRSNDYYSSRNYASRVVNGRLVFYAPLYLGRDRDPLAALPAMRRWRGGDSSRSGGFERIVSARRVYQPVHPMGESGSIALHTVTTCDLRTPELECDATVVIGAAGRVFYVSPTAVYVWVNEWTTTVADREAGAQPHAVLYRMPLDGSAPSALAVAGAPVDQFSFLEDDGNLRVLVRDAGDGDAMWRSNRGSGAVSLLSVPLASFGDGIKPVAVRRYLPLPTPAAGSLQNRFVGRHLLYGTGNGWGAPEARERELFVVGLDDQGVERITLTHATDRIESMGSDAVVIGSTPTDLRFSGIQLAGRPRVLQHFALRGASQGELRSHGFFYRADDRDSGVIGLPVRGPGRPGSAHLAEGSASVLFLRNAGQRFEELGELSAAFATPVLDDACRASCVDWYGNARPLFVRGRVFALMGYELVEGRLAEGKIREVDRVSYAPRALHAARE
jgi:hypothetical protein